MMNVSTASTNTASVETAQEESTSLQSTQSGLTGLSIVKARGLTPSGQDVSHFQQALTRTQDDGMVPLSGLENLKNGAVLDTHELSSTSQAVLNGHNVEVKTPVGTNPEVTDHENATAQLSARMRWLERRKLLEEDKDDLNSKTTTDDAVISPLVADAKLAQASMTSIQQSSMSVGRFQVHKAETQLHDSFGDSKNTENFSNPAASVLPTIEQANEASYVTVDTAWASRTVQDTVKATLRTLAQRDLESLDAGRPIQITLEQGQLRGARLTLEANDGLLEVSVATSQAQLRATLEAQQDALAQGLLRDVGAVRWVGLQDALSSGVSNNDSSSSFGNSQQGAQGNGSERQNQRQNPLVEADDVAVPETKSDRGQVIADAQSLRAFLGL